MFFEYEKALKEKLEQYEALINAKNIPYEQNNGQFSRWRNPVLTAAHTPLIWRYDFDKKSNPYFIERMGINAVFNSGAIYFNNKFMLMARVEGVDRKSFFAIAESDSGVDGFKFRDYPCKIPEIPPEANIYDIRLTTHEDGMIYGIFCSESKDTSSSDMSAALASAAVVRTRDMVNFERLPNIRTRSPQQRNVVLHPEFVNGQYMLYTRPQDGFIEAGSGGGICYGFCKDISNPVIDTEFILEPRRYHTITEAKNGAGTVPIKTERGWIHFAHGVRMTAAGLRYVIYVFLTALDNPTKVIAAPAGYFIAPEDGERIGDVSNVAFTNGAIERGGNVFIYYGGSDTRLYVATTTIERLIDYAFNTSADELNTSANNKKRFELITKNLEYIKNNQ